MLDGFLRFAAHLRNAGLTVPVAKVHDFLLVVPECDLCTHDDLYWIARALFVSRPDECAIFDDAFISFWRPKSSTGMREPSPHARPRAVSVPPSNGESEALGRLDRGEPVNRRYGKPQRTPVEPTDSGRGEGGGLLSYSPAEVLRRKDFAHFDTSEILAAQRVIAQLRWTVALRRSRRLQRAARGSNIDWRRTARIAMRCGGILLHFAYRQRKVVRRPIILLCDISGSMDRYTRLLLQFMHTVAKATNVRLETFVFGTQLSHITRSLDARDINRSLDALIAQVPDWSGGTRIAHAIAAFNGRYSKRLMHRGAIVAVLSDGWDCGDPQTLAAQIALLQRRSHRLIWVNPLPLGVPQGPGIHAVRPFVDDMVSAKNLQSLLELQRIFDSLESRRPARSRAVLLP